MLAIIDYEAGNLTSVKLAVEHLQCECVVTQSAAVIASAEKIIFPGVGTARSCMQNLQRLKLDAAIKNAVAENKPLLAICIGMQLLFDESEEDDNTKCLGILRGKVKQFNFPVAEKIKVPHMGWNEIMPTKSHPLFANFSPNSEAYFVHSYYVETPNNEIVIANTEYGGNIFTCAIAQKNLWAVQFHPEKSGEVGLRMLRNFCAAGAVI